MSSELSPSQLTALRELANDGWAVVVWTPEELGNASPTDVEDRSIEIGHQIIEESSA